jgi:hypothetical protein
MQLHFVTLPITSSSGLIVEILTVIMIKKLYQMYKCMNTSKCKILILRLENGAVAQEARCAPKCDLQLSYITFLGCRLPNKKLCSTFM